jgi:mannose-6-phosphate isomerase-like protein (cupin superfamily)
LAGFDEGPPLHRRARRWQPGAISARWRRVRIFIEGTLGVWLGGIERFRVEPGDMLYFESNQAHQWSNPSDKATVFLGVNTPATF